MSLLFLTTNPILYTPRPTVPTIISLEHIHIKPVKGLPTVSIISVIIKFLLPDVIVAKKSIFLRYRKLFCLVGKVAHIHIMF